MRRLTPTIAWGLIGMFALLYNLTSPPGGTLSEQADKWILKHPVLVRAAIVILAAHIGNLVPARYDPIHRAFNLRRRK